MGLSHQKGNTVTLSYRKETFSRIKERNAQRMREQMDRGRIAVLFNSQPVEIRDASVILDVAGERRELRNDYVWVFAGGIPPNEFLLKAGIRLGARDMTLDAQQEVRASK